MFKLRGFQRPPKRKGNAEKRSGSDRKRSACYSTRCPSHIQNLDDGWIVIQDRRRSGISYRNTTPIHHDEHGYGKLYTQSVAGKAQQDYFHNVPVILRDNNLQQESLKSYGPLTSITWQQLLRKRANTGHVHRYEWRNTLIYAHTTSWTLPTCDVSLGTITLPAPEAGNFVELLLL